MSRKNEVLILAFVVVLFTSLFVNVPLRIKVNPLQNAVSQMGASNMLESSNINEVLAVKLFLTYLLFSKTNISVKEFIMYAFGLEVMLLLVIKKSSFFLHTSTSIALFVALQKYFSHHRNKKNKPILI